MSEEAGKYLGEERQEQEYQIRDESAPRDFYSQIPNIVDIMELSPQAYRLYGHLRKVAGESGKCWQSTRTLALACDMSAGKVSESKAELEGVYPPLIRIESKVFDKGTYHEIAITDIWEINHRFWAGENVTIKTAKGRVVQNMNDYRSQYERLRSQYETKNNPIKNNPEPPFSAKLTDQELAEVNNKVDKILELNSGRGKDWEGRFNFRDNHLPYADWWHEKTNLVCKKKNVRSWQKAFSEWQDEGLQIPHLLESYEIDVAWKKVISDPNEITKKAVAIKAAKRPEETRPPVSTDENGAIISY